MLGGKPIHDAPTEVGNLNFENEKGGARMFKKPRLELGNFGNEITPDNIREYVNWGSKGWRNSQ